MQTTAPPATVKVLQKKSLKSVHNAPCSSILMLHPHDRGQLRQKDPLRSRGEMHLRQDQSRAETRLAGSSDSPQP